MPDPHRPDPHRPLSEGKATALKLLKLAYDDAEDTGEAPRQFAVKTDDLMARGATPSDLLWFLKLRYVEHVQDVTTNGERRRQLHSTDSLVLGPGSCFHLTYAGNAYANENGLHRPATAKLGSDTKTTRKLPHDNRSRPQQHPARRPLGGRAASSQVLPASSSPGARETPFWNKDEGHLYWHGTVILHLAPNASAERGILDAFEYVWYWESSIPNPIKRRSVGDPRRSRRNAVYNLNQRLGKKPPIKFFCLQGNTVGWRAVCRAPST